MDKFEEVFPLMKEAGFDGYLQRVTDVDRAIRMLDAAQSCGLMVIPGFSDLNSDPETFVPKIMNHPALMAYYLKDEPETWDLEELGKLVRRIQSIDTSIPSSVIVDDHGAFIKVDGPRRVKNVQVYEDGNFVDIDPNKSYTISSHDFLLDSGGDGANMFKDDETIPSEQLLDYEVVIKYIVNELLINTFSFSCSA